jgi:DNA-binding NarL/FixJ family response regulator
VVMTLDPFPLSRKDIQARTRSFAGEVRRLHKRGWSRKAIGDRLGIQPGTVGKYLREG